VLSERSLRILWLAPVANWVVGALCVACGNRPLGVANLVMGVVAVGVIKYLEEDGKISFFEHLVAEPDISPQDREILGSEADPCAGWYLDGQGRVVCPDCGVLEG
jgi:hypothetical protein